MILTDAELNKIINWLPYRNDWPIDRNQIENGIQVYYGELITQFKQNSLFNLYVLHDSGMSNYLEYECYPNGDREYSGPAISVLISLCAPIAAFGQINCVITEKSASFGDIIPEEAGVITAPELFPIKSEIIKILTSKSIGILEKKFLSQTLPKELSDQIFFPLGDQYLHGIFQMED
jgi:hypothetical protein